MGADLEQGRVICAVCGELADRQMTAECNWCDRRFHLNQRNDVEAKDCGDVWIDEQYLALQFACATCLAKDADDGGAIRPVAASSHGGQGAPARLRRYKRRA